MPPCEIPREARDDYPRQAAERDDEEEFVRGLGLLQLRVAVPRSASGLRKEPDL
jgi:hypothetical protein